MGLMSFPKDSRLLHRGDFQKTMNRGSKVVCPLAVLLAVPSRKNSCRLGIIVSKRVSKKAHDRNKIKRYIRECFRVSNIRSENMDLVVIARSGSESADWISWQKFMTKSLNKIAVKLHPESSKRS